MKKYMSLSAIIAFILILFASSIFTADAFAGPKYYIKDIRISASKNEEEARQIAGRNDYVLVDIDLDKGASSYHVYMSVLYGEGLEDAITDVCVMQRPYVVGSWQKVAHFGESDYFCINAFLNSKKDEKLRYYFLYTRDPKKPPLTEIRGQYSNDKNMEKWGAPWESINYANSHQIADFNKGVGCPHIYMFMKRDWGFGSN